MASNILTTDIDELYPVAGSDNDSQGFRDNFRLVKTGLATAATGITSLQTTSAKLNAENDFNGNVIREANFIANSEEAYVTDEVTASQDLRFVNGNYQVITVGADVTLTVDINNLGEAEIATGDFIAFSDEGATGDPTKKESIDDVATLFAGTGLTAASAVMSVDYGSSAGNAVEGNTTITLTQTSGEIDITGTAAQALGGAPSYTVGLADTISGNRTFSGDTITINKDLVVQGTASFQSTTNLEVSDRFVLFASGSTSTGDGGIVVQQDTQDVGELFGYDSGTTRWGVTSSFSADGSAYTPDAFMSAVVEGAANDPTAVVSKYTKKGNIFVANNEDIYIYS